MLPRTSSGVLHRVLASSLLHSNHGSGSSPTRSQGRRHQVSVLRAAATGTLLPSREGSAPLRGPQHPEKRRASSAQGAPQPCKRPTPQCF